MDVRSVAYMARMKVAEAMAATVTSEILSEMLGRATWLFAQSVNTAYLAAQVLLENASAPGAKQWDDVGDILQGALLHDAGMLSLPDQILSSTGKLDEAGRAAMMTHPDAGCRMLEELGVPERALRIVAGHHERMDGSGYPSGRAPEYYGTKLVAVCDVYAAMTSERSYRRAFNIYEASEIMSSMPLSQGALMDLKSCPDI